MSGRRSLLVLGLGNAICRDDGIGPAVVARIRRTYECPDEVDVLDGGTLGLALLPYLEQARALILVDAVRTDDPPGTLVRLEDDEVAPVVATRLSVHQVGVADVLEAARLLNRMPGRLVLLGLVPASLDLGVGCSPVVAAALPALTRAVVDEMRILGHELAPRRPADTLAGDADVLPDVLGL